METWHSKERNKICEHAQGKLRLGWGWGQDTEGYETVGK